MLSDEFKQTVLAILDDKYVLKSCVERDFNEPDVMNQFGKDNIFLEAQLEPNTELNKTSKKVYVTIHFYADLL